MKQVYLERRNALIDSLQQHFGRRVEIGGEQAGLHLLVRFDTHLNDDELLQNSLSAGIGLFSTREFYTQKPRPHEFIFGYANLEPYKIRDGIARLASIIT